MTRLAVFDCDGTLVDGQAAICKAMEHAFADVGLPAPGRDRVRRIVGLSVPQAAAALLPDSSPAVQTAVATAYKRSFAAARTAGELDQPLFPHIAELLAGLHDTGWQLAVATGMSRRGLTHCLAVNRLETTFASLQTADAHPSKPHPAMLEAALAQTGTAPADAVMIGDTTFDIAMAATAQVRAIGVAWGYHEPRELLAAGAEHVAISPAGLGRYLAA